jgi:thiosulfate dehydrogenase (quinone) large subunit
MSNGTPHSLSSVQQFALVLLRTLIGWHFLYEGYYKLMLPGWGPDGKPLGAWTSAGYLRGASGPLAGLFKRMVDAGWTPWLDGAVKFTLIAIGLSLILGLFTRLGAVAALALLALFYILAIPWAGVPQPNNEGTYLIVNKTLIEAAAVFALLVFDTGAMAGLDLLLSRRRRRVASPVEAKATS